MGATEMLTPTWDTRYQYGNEIPDCSTRPAYESACVAAAVAPMTDADIRQQSGGLLHREYRGEEWRALSRDARVSWLLAAARAQALKAPAAQYDAALEKTQQGPDPLDEGE